MENENKKELMKIFNQNKTYRNLVIGSILIGIFLIAISIILDSRALPEAKNIEEVIDSDQYSEGYVYAITECFATYSVDGSITDEYYMVWGNNSVYILNLSKKQYNEIIAKMEDENNTEDIVMYGMSESTPTDLKDLAIDAYNEMYETEDLDSTNYYELFSPYVLNATRNPNDSSNVFLDIGIITLIVSVIFLITYLILLIRTKSNLKKISKTYDLAQISMELSSPTKMDFKRTKIIFLDSYLISYSNTLDVIKYTDIVWMYPHEQRVNGVKSAMQIMVVTKDRKRHMVATISAMGKNNKEEYENVYSELINRRPTALLGYTNENLVAMSKNNVEETIAKVCKNDIEQ